MKVEVLTFWMTFYSNMHIWRERPAGSHSEVSKNDWVFSVCAWEMDFIRTSRNDHTDSKTKFHWDCNCINLNAKEMVSVGWDILGMGRLQRSPVHLYSFWGNQKAEQLGIDWCSLTQNRSKRFWEAQNKKTFPSLGYLTP